MYLRWQGSMYHVRDSNWTTISWFLFQLPAIYICLIYER